MNKKYRKQIPLKKYDKATGKYVKTMVSIKDLEKAGHRLDGKSCPKCHRKPCWSKEVDSKRLHPVEEAPKKNSRRSSRSGLLTKKQNQVKITSLQKQLIDFGKNKSEEIKKLQDRVKEQEENYTKYRNYLSKDEITCIKLLYEKGNSIQRIAQIMDRAKCTIADHLKKLDVKKGEKPTYQQVKDLEKNKEVDSTWGGTHYTKSPEETISPTEGNGNTEPAPDGGVAHIFELRTGRKVDYHNKVDKNIYNRIYKRIRHGGLDPVKDLDILVQEETDDDRAERIMHMHQKGLEVGGAEMINFEEHNDDIGSKDGCAYCDPNSPWTTITIKEGKNKGYTDYDVFIRDRNFRRKQIAIKLGQHKPHATPVHNPPTQGHPIHQEDCICPECEEKRSEEARLAQPDPETNGKFTIGGKHVDRVDQVKEVEKPTMLEPKDIIPHGKTKKQLDKMIKRREGIERADVANARAKQRLDEEIERLRKKAGESKK